MSTLRQQLAAVVRQQLPDAVVCSYPTEPAQVQRGRPFVDVYVTDIARDGEHRLKHTLRLDAYVSRTQGDEAEAEAEDLRDEVLLALQRVEGLDWTGAQRVNFADGAFIGYSITVVYLSVDVYENTIREEAAHV